MTVGITGGIGSGKSTITQELAKRGYRVYDCDREAKRIIAEKAQVRDAIIALLGHEAFANGQYNTTYVAKRVFADPRLLEALNSIVHPAVKEDIRNSTPFKEKSEISLFIESAILFEAGLDELCDKIIVVEAPEEVRLSRTLARDYQGIATTENINKVRARIRAQKSPACPKASQGNIYCVSNDGSLVLSRVVDLVCDIAAR